MGQGADSAESFGYQFGIDEASPLIDGLYSNTWTMRDGTEIKVRNMQLRHLNNARRMCEIKALNCSFSCDSQIYEQWIDIFDTEIKRKKTLGFTENKTLTLTPRKKNKQVDTSNLAVSNLATGKGKMSLVKCHSPLCNKTFEVRIADIKRGWGKFCSKRCKAINQSYGK